jgi:cytochrome b
VDTLRRVRVWDLPLRLFHWLLVAAIALAFLSSEEDSPLNDWHILAGWVTAVLILFRLAWGFIGGEHSRFSDFVRPSRLFDHVSGLAKGRIEPSLGHNPLGAMSVLLILFLIAVTVGTGAFGGESSEELHELIAWTLLAVIALHILAVVVMSVLQRENLVRAMVSGTKPASHHPDSRDAAAPSLFGLVLGAIVVLGTVFAILQYDPQAFTLRPSESLERAHSGPQPLAGEEEEEEDRD